MTLLTAVSLASFVYDVPHPLQNTIMFKQMYHNHHDLKQVFYVNGW